MFADIPFPLLVMLLGAAYWPAFLIAIVAAVGTGVTFRGTWRIVLFVVAGLLAADTALGFLLVVGV